MNLDHGNQFIIKIGLIQWNFVHNPMHYLLEVNDIQVKRMRPTFFIFRSTKVALLVKEWRNICLSHLCFKIPNQTSPMDDGCSESESARGTRGSSKGSQRRYSPRTHNLFWIHPPVAAAVRLLFLTSSSSPSKFQLIFNLICF